MSFGDDVTRAYVRALEARRIPHVLVGGRSFHEREEVEALRNALAAIEWPDDELSRLRDAARAVLRARATTRCSPSARAAVARSTRSARRRRATLDRR